MMYRIFLLGMTAVLIRCCCGCAAGGRLPGAIRGEVMQNYAHGRFRKNFQEYRAAVERAATRADALHLVAKAQARVKRSFRFPAEVSPLDARSHGTVAYGKFNIEKISFRSRPGFTVTAHLYLPVNFTAPLPAVVIFCGHSGSGKYWYGKTMAASLANDGYAVLVVDPLHQGERRQFDRSIGLTAGHNIINRHLLLTGEDFSSWRVWDGLRAIEYIRSRKEIDRTRIALTGASGGGTLTSLVGACSDKVSAVAPSCYVTTFYHNVRNELAVDAEQLPVGFLADGGEMADFFIAQAPRPVAIIAQKRDFFDYAGAVETFKMVRKVYKLLGAEERVRLVSGAANHTFEAVARQGLHKFLNDNFKSGAPAKIVTAGSDFPTQQQLWVMPGGSVAALPGERNICDYAIEKMAQLRQMRKRAPLSLPQMQKRIREILQLPERLPVPEYHSLRPVINLPEYRKYVPSLFRFDVTTEPGMRVTLLVGKNDFVLSPGRKVLLYLPDQDSRQEMGEFLPVPPDTTLCGLDYRGRGELAASSGTPTQLAPEAPYGAEYHFASLALLEGGSMISGRVRDILSVIKLLEANGAQEITLCAAGGSHAPAIFAALLAEKRVKLKLIGELVTYEAASRRDKKNPALQSLIPFGILKTADLDELLNYCRMR